MELQLNKIHLGDVLVLLSKLADNSVDYVITSPPYNKGLTANWSNGIWQNPLLKAGYGDFDDTMPHEEYVEWQHKILTECWRVIKPTGAIFYNHKPQPKNKEIQLPLIYNPGLPLRQVIIWSKNRRVNYSEHHWVPTHEWIMVLAGPAFKLRSRGAGVASDVWHIDPDNSKKHPAPFPIKLPRTILEAVPRGVVLDIFAGSGTTCVAAAQLGYDYIGFERNAAYIEIAEARIAEVRLAA